MTHVVLVQAIGTTWTKVSRGGRLATVRHEIPQALTVPLEGIQPHGTAYLLHEVRYDESNAFQAPILNRMRPQPMPAFLTPADGNVAIVFVDGVVRIELIWRWGAPMRNRKIDLFTLNCEEWGRVRYNYRSGFHRTWDYAHWVFNIAVSSTSDLRSDHFTATLPNHRYVNLADLW
ncbi:MAG TPA: hypothetical protein VFL91_20490 [Thermomicrobiales bacterium]|nr:hypothetical protein [Thermomicrobiales bacterium]